MYSEYAMENTEPTPEQLYIDKLRHNLIEIQNSKIKSIAEENFTMAEAYRSKVNALAAQLAQMESRGNSDLMRNCLAQWQHSFSTHITQCIESYSASQIYNVNIY